MSEETELERMREQRDVLAVCLYDVLYGLHRVYGNTSGPHGGIGGSAITAWCHVNNPYTIADEELLSRAEFHVYEVTSSWSNTQGATAIETAQRQFIESKGERK